jgi:pimeloyl-ACP methyl ester carboxylesterase
MEEHMPKVTVNGMQLAYTEAGSGPPFLFLPGTGGGKEYWAEYQVPFFSKYFRVITLDQRGIGESDRVEDHFETRDLANDAVAVLDAIGATEPAHILGHSMGGRTAQWIALDHPERVRSLLLVSSGSGEYDPAKPVDRCPPIWQTAQMIDMGFEAYTSSRMKGRLGFTDAFRAAHPEVPEKMFNTWWATKPTPFTHLLYSRSRQRHETTDRLGEIQCPALVVYGGDDTVMGGTSFHPASSAVLAERIPKGELLEIPGAAHHIFWEIPDVVNTAILEYLQKH